MKNNLFLYTILVLTFLFTSCDKDGDILPGGSDDPVVEEDEPVSGIDTLITADGVSFVRTPEEHFQDLPDWPYPYQYVEIDGLRQAYAEAGPADGEVVLLLHGQPSWGYLYRKMMPVLADAGYHVIAMDHVGMGRSDKPVDIDYYTYLGHNERLEEFINALGLRDIHLFVQDWGSLIGLRVAGLNPDWFATISVGDGNLPVVPAGVEPFPPVTEPDVILDISSPYASFPAQQVPFYDGCDLIMGPEDNSFFGDWMTYAMKGRSFKASETLEALTWYDLPTAEEAAYDAPFPSREYMAGIRKFPSLVNELPGTTQQAWAGLTAFTRPFLTIWAANDPGTLGACETQQNLVGNIPGAAGKPHVRLPEASHFLQDDQGEEIARRLVEFYRTDWDNVPEEVCADEPGQDPGRYCEILLGYQRNGEVVAEVWGTPVLNTCPGNCWEALDPAAIQAENGALFITMNGPRIWLPRGEIQLPDNPVGDSRYFGGLEMRLLASLVIDPAVLANGGAANGGPYSESTVLRNTVYEYPAGTEVYELTAPDGAIYTMQSISLIVNPDLTRADLPNLGSMLSLPDGWTYQARQLDEDLILVAEGEATVITDDLGNTYQKRASGAKVGFEILQIVSPEEIVVWLGLDITLEAFNALELPQGWIKNQPREGDADMGAFARSPNASAEGEFTEAEHFGYSWRHNATIVDLDVELPDGEGLLAGRLISKFHEIGFNAGKTLNFLISPEGERYVRVSRDADRTSNLPTIPSSWSLVEEVITEDLILQLPNPTLNIRTDNEDSFQGPI